MCAATGLSVREIGYVIIVWYYVGLLKNDLFMNFLFEGVLGIDLRGT